MQIHVCRGRGENMISVQSLECPVPQCLGADVVCSWGACCPTRSFKEGVSAVQRKHVLVMEDEPDLGKLCQLLLEDEGYQVTLIPGQQKALAILTSNTHFDIVCSDGTGWKQCYTAAIKKFGKENVIVYTGDLYLVESLSQDGITAFIKSASDEEEYRTLSGIVGEIKKLVPVTT